MPLTRTDPAAVTVAAPAIEATTVSVITAIEIDPPAAFWSAPARPTLSASISPDSVALALTSPLVLVTVAVSMLAGVIATTFAVLVGFYGAVAAHNLGLDPDNHGIPIVTSSLDLLGAVALILVIVLLGLT